MLAALHIACGGAPLLKTFQWAMGGRALIQSDSVRSLRAVDFLKSTLVKTLPSEAPHGLGALLRGAIEGIVYRGSGPRGVEFRVCAMT